MKRALPQPLLSLQGMLLTHPMNLKTAPILMDFNIKAILRQSLCLRFYVIHSANPGLVHGFANRIKWHGNPSGASGVGT